MPSDKKRVNLTIPDDLYQRIQEYKQRQGVTNDASACLQLIVQQLNGLEQSQTMLRLLNSLSVDQIMELSRDGLKKRNCQKRSNSSPQGNARATCGVSRNAARIHAPPWPCCYSFRLANDFRCPLNLPDIKSSTRFHSDGLAAEMSR